MSFGYGISEGIKLIEIINDLRKRFVAAAPAKLSREIQEEINSLSNVLQDVKKVLSQERLTDWQQAALQTILTGCEAVLSELTMKKVVDDSRSAANSSRFGWRGKPLRTLKRITWDQDEVKDLRSRIALHVGFLNTFNGSFNSKALFDTKRGVDKLLMHQDALGHREVYQSLLNWLSPIDCPMQRNDFLRRRQAGNGEWLLRSKRFEDWVQKPKQMLVCWGLPGAGKTMIAAIVIDDLETRFQNNNDVGIAYLFCTFKPQYEQPEDLLASLIKQLVEEGFVPDNVMDLLNQCKSKGMRLSRDETSNGLSSVISYYSGIFIVIDALDECQGDCRTKYLEKMLSLQEKTEIINFATSRLIPEVVKAFKGKASLEIRASKEDVQEYLDGNLSRLPSFVQSSKSLQDEVKAEIGKAVDGLFLSHTSIWSP